MTSTSHKLPLTGQQQIPDLDSREQIEQFVDRFYARLLATTLGCTIIMPATDYGKGDVAAIDLAVHLPHIKDYWCKLLLGDRTYRRHTMNIHRELHGKQPLQAADFQRWLAMFNATLDDGFFGQQTERARRVGNAVIG